VIGAWMLYAALVAVALAAAGAAAERACRLLGLPQRWVWVAAIAATLLLPLLLPLQRTAELPPVPGGPLRSEVVAPRRAPAEDRMAPAVGPGAEWEAALADALRWGWALASAAGVTVLGVSAVTLRRRRRRWRRARVAGTEVLVSARTGPAVLGVVRS
jgi:hypothetical protein